MQTEIVRTHKAHRRLQVLRLNFWTARVQQRWNTALDMDRRNVSNPDDELAWHPNRGDVLCRSWNIELCI